VRGAGSVADSLQGGYEFPVGEFSIFIIF